MSDRSGDGAARSRAPKLDVQRIRVDAQGYDDTGAYWGAGPEVFILTTEDGDDEVTVRARSAVEARRKALAELARRPGEPRSVSRDPIGGASPHKSRFEIDWTDSNTGEIVRIRITHARDYLASGSDHVEVESIAPERARLPITETGYRSHFLPALELINAGGPVTFVTSWLDREARSKTWTTAAGRRAQGDLFAWADAQGEVDARRKPRSARPAAAAKPGRKPAKGRAPE